MPHQHPDSADASQQNTVGDRRGPNDRAAGEQRSVHQEPRSYAAKSVEDATLAPPAAGEMPDYLDDGDASGGAQQGATNTNRDAHSHRPSQGPKTQKANRQILKNGRAD